MKVYNREIAISIINKKGRSAFFILGGCGLLDTLTNESVF
jgi:hypothetical protein